MSALVVLASLSLISGSQPAGVDGGKAVPLEPGRLRLYDVAATAATHDGRTALRVAEPDGRKSGGLAVVESVSLLDGEIALDVAGRRGAFAVPEDRGFVGLAFRIAPQASRYEYVYLRPDNGRADDQVRRNHSTQYASHPEFPWPVLRKSFPGKYESYVDLQPGVWTHMRLVIRSSSVRLYVNRADQPALVVGDLKLEPAGGHVGLWIGPGTEAYFTNLSVKPATP
jgi:hypothetical protein